MKGQFIFEFLVAGLIFFAVIVYSINYLNVNVSDFKNNFYQSRLQGKAMQISDILMDGSSPLSIAENADFNFSKIETFNSTYCGMSNYQKLIDDFYLYEMNAFGFFANDVKIHLFNSTDTIMNCGIESPMNVEKAEIIRFGTLDDGIKRLSVVLWGYNITGR